MSVQLYQHNFVGVSIFKKLITGDFLQNTIGSTLNRSSLDLETLRQDSDYLLALLMKNEMCESQNSHYQEIAEKAKELLKLLESK